MTAIFNPSGVSAVLMGDESLTIACGDMALAGGHRIIAVVTRDTAVSDWAKAHEITVFDGPRDLVRAKEPFDWLLSVANLRIIPREVLACAAKGAINFHDGPLPQYAGLNTPAWAIINQETSHGVSWHMIEEGVDEGDLLAQQNFEIAPDETAFSLNSKCYAAGMESFATVLGQLETGVLLRERQDLSQRRYFAKDQRPDGMGVLDLRQSGHQLSALVRGLDFGGYANPLTLPKLALATDHFVIPGTLTVEEAVGAAGQVLSVSEHHVTVAVGNGAVTLSALRSLDGAQIKASDILADGDLLPEIRPPESDVRGEDVWRRVLASTPPMGVPLATDDAPGPVETMPLSVPAKLSLEKAAGIAALTALQSAGRGAAHIALWTSNADPLQAPWKPIAVRAAPTDPVPEVLSGLETQITQALREPDQGMARDLLLRDPAIPEGVAPLVGLSFGADPLPGALLTVRLAPKRAELCYDSGRITEDVAQVLAARLDASFAAAETAKTCSDLWALPETERTLQLETWNNTARAYERTTVHAAFEAQVARTPNAEAVVFEGRSLSFGALNAKSNQVAHRLREEGAGPGMPVGLYMSRGLDLLVGVLGILKAGAAYVPLDPTYPADRIAHYIADSGAPILLTQSALSEALPQSSAQVIEIDGDAALKTRSAMNPAPQATPEDLAYLIYTSGSTGTPKGVMVSHGNVANFFAGMDDRIDHDTGSVWLAVTSLSFDISVLELFWTLARGFKLVLAGDESRTLISNGPIGGLDRKIDFNLFYWGNDDGVGPKKYELLLEGAKFADANGFNAVWTPERHFHAFGGPYPNPSVTGAAVAAVTKNIDVRAGSCVAPLHHPARIAEEWGVIDNLTNGRVGLAIASGWQPDDFVLRPENTPPDNKPAMYEAIHQLRQLWRGEAVAFPTKDGTPFEVVTQPRPVSQELPIWVTTAGNPQTWKEAGEIGANVLTHLLGQSVEEVGDKIKIYHSALRAAGHDPSEFKVTVMLHTYLAESRQASEDVARGPMKDYLRSAAGLIKQYAWAFPAFKKPEGATNPFDVDLDGLSAEEMDAILEFAFQRYFNDSGLFGTVADGVARAEELKRIGVDEIACLIDYGIATDKVMAGLAPLAQVLERSNAATTLAEDDFSLAAQIVRHSVTHLQCTPSMAQMLVTNEEAQQALGRLDHLLVGGEALPGTLADALHQHLRGDLQNMYGPTETTIWSTSQRVQDGAMVTASIGTPIANTQCFILDGNMDPQPIGLEGELWIGGDGVTQGYWAREALTDQRFVVNPFGPGKLYRTGDLAAWGPDGALRFAGRADAQVKIRGHRIELGEIEAKLASHPSVIQAVVIAREAPGGAQLVGYVTLQEAVRARTLRQALADDLPEIMVPAAIVILDQMPLTPNKKIDRQALPAPRMGSAPKASPDAPKSAAQAAVAKVWTAILGVSDIRAEDNFFALGGHSLLAVQAHREIKSALGNDKLSITDIFRFPTLEGLAGYLEKDAAPAQPKVEASSDRAGVMSKRRAMRAGRSRTRA